MSGFAQKIKGALKKLTGHGALPPVEFGGLRAQCLTAWPDGQLLDAWDALLSKSPSATPFHSPTWARAVWRQFGREGALRLIAVWRADQLLAILPMQQKDDRTLETQGLYISDYLEPLIAAGEEPAAWPAIYALLRPHFDRGGSAVFHNIRDGAPGIDVMKAVAAQNALAVGERIIEQTPVLALPTTFDEYMESLEGHERRETRRRLNKALTQGAAQLVAVPADDHLPAQLSRAIELMCGAGGEKAAAIQKYVGPLLHEVAADLIRSGRMQLLILQIAGQPAACLIQFPTATGPLFYNCGYDPAQKQWAPGTIALVMAIRQAIEAGQKSYDMLRGQEPHKYRLGAKDRALLELTIAGASGAV